MRLCESSWDVMLGGCNCSYGATLSEVGLMLGMDLDAKWLVLKATGHGTDNSPHSIASKSRNPLNG